MESTESTRLVLKYQAGDEEAGNKLLEKYQSVVQVFFKTFYYGIYYENRKIVQSFVRLLCSKGVKNRKETIVNILSVISNNYKTRYDPEDLKQDIKEAILKTALKYDPLKIDKPFEYYFSFYFAYVLKNNLIDNLEQTINISKENNAISFIHFKRKNDITDVEDEFDEVQQFLDGEFENDIFNVLNREERELLKLYYLDNKNLAEIIKIKGYEITIGALSIRLKNIRKKIKQNRGG